jgi:histidine triad (HIT) family protein
MKILFVFALLIAPYILTAADNPKKCVFCDIVSGKEAAFTIWESSTHIAFLSKGNSGKGSTIVIPKKHFSSYAFALDDKDLCALVLAAKTVSKILDKKLPNVMRTIMVLEGLEIDHVHAKLYPAYGANTAKSKDKKCIETDLKELAACLKK